MLDPVSSSPQPVRRLLPPQKADSSRQRQLMVGALLLLLTALAILLYADRNFWFPDNQEVDDQSTQPAPAETSSTARSSSAPDASRVSAKRSHRSKPDLRGESSPGTSSEPPLPIRVSERTVLPPLEVEVVAGDVRRSARPNNNSLQVDLQRSASSPSSAEASAATITSNAAERVEMSSNSTAVVNRSVKPTYPVLARQMRVQGSVVLQALIGKDGLIENLHVVNGPPILATAAEDAVKQWHFKPHYVGSEAVETQAKITVNFTISTN